jgi:hypothetical protein
MDVPPLETKRRNDMMYTYHPVDDKDKVARLAESMETNGWQGAPIVKWGEQQLLTGCHRYNAAAKTLGWSDKEIPMIDLEDVFAEDGKDFETLHAEHNSPTTSDSDVYDFCQLLDELSDDIKARYGIDIEY